LRLPDDDDFEQLLFPVFTFFEVGGIGEAQGRGRNFPGKVAEWEWKLPEEWKPYRLNMAAMGYSRESLKRAFGTKIDALARYLAASIAEEDDVSPQEVRDRLDGLEASGEFPLGMISYYILACGLILLSGEQNSEEDVRYPQRLSKEQLKRVLEGDLREFGG
jgi:hypothetical protein